MTKYLLQKLKFNFNKSIYIQNCKRFRSFDEALETAPRIEKSPDNNNFTNSHLLATASNTDDLIIKLRSIEIQ